MAGHIFEKAALPRACPFCRIDDRWMKQMRVQGQGGSIVNAASVSGLLAIPTAGPYVASKHAVLGLTKTAAGEYGKDGIRVNAVIPGAVRTEMLLDVLATTRLSARWSEVHPVGRIGEPEEIADAVVWLFSDRSSYYTGQSLTLDGGLTAQRSITQRSANESIAASPQQEAIEQAELPLSRPASAWEVESKLGFIAWEI